METANFTACKIEDDRVVTIYDIEPGQFFVSRTKWQTHKNKRILMYILERTTDPFKAKTLLGTLVRVFPSERVHPVTMKMEGQDENEGRMGSVDSGEESLQDTST